MKLLINKFRYLNDAIFYIKSTFELTTVTIFSNFILIFKY